jgi:catecholate siderophore receptor
MLNSRARMMTALAALFTLGAAPVWAAETTEQAAADTITVTGRFLSIDRLNAVKTPTPVLDVPQSLSIVTRAQLEDQAFSSIADILRYTPGLAVSQGEGHRDAIIIRGNQSTADFFLDGLRDDVQYYRPLYNLEQVEILRGANALLFGRGGGGGVVNRVTKTAQLDENFGGLTSSLDTFGAYQLSGDVNSVLSDTVAFRVNVFGEHQENHRDVFEGDRFAVNPTFTLDLGNRTQAVFSYEYVNDDRVVDRGVPSVTVVGGPDVPLDGYRDTFFGSADGNYTTLEASIFRTRLDHTFSDTLRGNVTIQYADYDKYYQNIYSAGFDAAASPQRLTLDGYADETTRQNFIAQGNLVGEFDTGAFSHTVLLGVEYGDQSTSNARIDNTFAASNDDQITIDFSTPVTVPDYAFVDTLRDRESDVQFASLYLQDQIDLTEQLKLVLGLRFDRFDVDVLDREAVSATDDGRRGRVDEEVSPRLGLIYKPAENVSLYASYAESFLPSAGDQFLTLTRTTEDVQPQQL